MDMILQALLSWQFLIFCLAIAAITFVIRRIVEYILDNPKIPASKTSKLWTELILPIMPVILGCVAGIVSKQYPYPTGLELTSGRIAFGLVAGLLSTLVYRVINAFLTSKITIQSDISNENIESLANKVRDTINTRIIK